MQESQHLSPEKGQGLANGDGEQFDSGELSFSLVGFLHVTAFQMTALGKVAAVYWVALGLDALMAIFWVLWIGEGCVSHIVEHPGGSVIDKLGKFWLLELF